ncbi:MerR family transcriptional regulator [Magnetospirillum sulfuroxidans]|uniref:Helix-turn-helix domain-containing protein n=1 Tax=Magnetospirillum sulfuroxidans TaxID=611300 RepID=A0ABS5IFR3_9PROT|nr:helix-turn-helix domain-containing protein [Magnetospirillum sulfuroxidans]MBR9973251.1 helix-turn-helix domain-containing protein [Magnetospirillum sulfuroxidans]
MPAIAIGPLADETGIKIPTIRYYEEIGLLPSPPRSRGNRRLYPMAAIGRLRFIRHARDLGFDIDAIRQLLTLADQPDHSCAEADRLARIHLDDIESKIARLEALRDEVRHMVADCAQDRIRQCRVIEVLADHGQCRHDHPPASSPVINNR